MTNHITWKEQRKNILAAIKDRPGLIPDAIDAAYLAGLETCASREVELRQEIAEKLGKIEIYFIQHEKWCDTITGLNINRCNCRESEAWWMQKEIRDALALINPKP